MQLTTLRATKLCDTMPCAAISCTTAQCKTILLPFKEQRFTDSCSKLDAKKATKPSHACLQRLFAALLAFHSILSAIAPPFNNIMHENAKNDDVLRDSAFPVLLRQFTGPAYTAETYSNRAAFTDCVRRHWSALHEGMKRPIRPFGILNHNKSLSFYLSCPKLGRYVISLR